MSAEPVVDVVEAIADAEGRTVEDLDISLQDHIDTDALRLLAADDTNAWSLTFEVPDHEVTVTSDGLVLVDGAERTVCV